MKRQGYVHLYTGNGKGKTTAAVGLAVRAVCAGLTVYFAQFVKSMQYNETRIARLFAEADSSFGHLRYEQLGSGCYFDRTPGPEDIRQARAALDKCHTIMANGEADMVVLDEICIAIHVGLLTVDEVIHAVRSRRENVEVVLTGRYAPSELVKLADLVTDMREVKHYYHNGVLSRNGIDH